MRRRVDRILREANLGLININARNLDMNEYEHSFIWMCSTTIKTVGCDFFVTLNKEYDYFRLEISIDLNDSMSREEWLDIINTINARFMGRGISLYYTVLNETPCLTLRTTNMILEEESADVGLVNIINGSLVVVPEIIEAML